MTTPEMKPLTEDQIHDRYNVLAYIFGKDHLNDPAYFNNLNDLRSAALLKSHPTPAKEEP